MVGTSVQFTAVLRPKAQPTQARTGFQPVFGSPNPRRPFRQREPQPRSERVVVQAQRLVGFCHQNESGRNKPSIPWKGDGGVFAAASFGPPTPTFWLEAGPEFFACTQREGEGRVLNVGVNPPCTPRLGVHCCCSASAGRHFRTIDREPGLLIRAPSSARRVKRYLSDQHLQDARARPAMADGRR